MSKHVRNTFPVVLFLSLIVVRADAQNTAKRCISTHHNPSTSAWMISSSG